MHLHRLAEERSRAYHRAVAQRVQRDPALLDVARRRVDSWLAEGRAAEYARRWKLMLDGPLTDLLTLMVDESERARAMRQATPFAGMIDQRERMRIWREVAERFHGAA